MIWIWISLGMLGLAGLAYIRLAPSDPALWHVQPRITGDEVMANGVKRRLAGVWDQARALDAIARETPRTTVLAGSVDAGRITYITRSRLFGFPDYTTLARDGEDLLIWARLRFGQSDMGVNRARVQGWLDALGR